MININYYLVRLIYYFSFFVGKRIRKSKIKLNKRKMQLGYSMYNIFVIIIYFKVRNNFIILALQYIFIKYKINALSYLT